MKVLIFHLSFLCPYPTVCYVDGRFQRLPLVPGSKFHTRKPLFRADRGLLKSVTKGRTTSGLIADR